MLTDAQLFACGVYGNYGDGTYYAPPAVEFRREAAPWRLRDLLGDAPPPRPPLISVVEIDGQRPSYEQVARITAELEKVPAAILSSWRASGGQIQIVGGRQARLDPGDRAANGWYRPMSKLLLVAAQAPPDCVLHEMGHAFDGSGKFPGRFSSLPAWRRICQGRPATAVRFNVAEMFAEDFRDYFFSLETRAAMLPEARRFIEETTR